MIMKPCLSIYPMKGRLVSFLCWRHICNCIPQDEKCSRHNYLIEQTTTFETRKFYFFRNTSKSAKKSLHFIQQSRVMVPFHCRVAFMKLKHTRILPHFCVIRLIFLFFSLREKTANGSTVLLGDNYKYNFRGKLNSTCNISWLIAVLTSLIEQMSSKCTYVLMTTLTDECRKLFQTSGSWISISFTLSLNMGCCTWEKFSRLRRVIKRSKLNFQRFLSAIVIKF